MEEKVIIQSKKYNVKKLVLIILLIGAAIATIFLIIGLIAKAVELGEDKDFYGEIYDDAYDTYRIHNKSGYCSKYQCSNCELINKYPSKQVYINERSHADFGGDLIPRGVLWLIILIILGSFGLIALILFFWLRSYRLTVTDKRVYGTAAFGRRADLPVDSISAISKIRLFKGISVSTSSGKIKFLLLRNYHSIYSSIIQLLIDRQNSQTSPTDIPDLILKYKKLLDDGLINQEEYDKKKNELLKK